MLEYLFIFLILLINFVSVQYKQFFHSSITSTNTVIAQKVSKMNDPLEIYYLLQEALPELKKQTIPQDSQDFANFRDWMNEHHAYMQYVEIKEFYDNGISDSEILKNAQIDTEALEKKIGADVNQIIAKYGDKYTEDEFEKLSIDEGQAQRILDLTSRGSSSHSAWLMFMYPRLLLARDILSKEGTIFISIDDNEQANLKLICDDIFGPDNFVTQIIVQSNKRGQTYKQIAKTHEYVLVYTKNIDGKINELLKEIGSFTMSDEVGEFSERELRNRNPKFGRFNRPNLFYPVYVNASIIDKNGHCPISLVKEADYTVEVYPYNSIGEESCWRWGTKKLENNNNENTLLSNIVYRLN